MDTEALNVVTGAFGFTGYYITRRLLSLGKRVKTLTRDPDRPNPFGDRLVVAAFDFDNLVKLTRSLQGASVLYNTYWVRFAYGRITFETAIANTKALIRACEAADVPRIVHLSVTNASEDSPLPYYRGKGIVEKAIMSSSLSYAILRPALIFGPGDVLINNIAWFLRHFPVFSVMGAGEYHLQCVFVEDVAEIAIQSAERNENLIIDVVSQEMFTFDGLVRLIADKVRSRAKIVHFPPALVRGLLSVAGYVLRDVVLTRDEISGLMSNLLVSQSAPVGRTRLHDWLDRHASGHGRTYASELGRHYR